MNFKQHGYISDAGMGKFYDVLPKELTLNFNQSLYESQQTTRQTMFKEVNRLPYLRPFWVEKLESELDNLQRNSSVNWPEYLYKIIKRTIKRLWKPKKLHVIGHSSGWDSRVVSMAIKDLHAELGDEWIGSVLFIEAHGEGDTFKEIMKVEGWNESQYYVHREGMDPYFEMNFAEHWKRFDGMVSFPVNQWLDPFRNLKDVQYFTGYGANEVDEQAYKRFKSVAKYHEWHYDLQLSWFNHIDETIFLFWEEDYIKAFWQFDDIRNHKERITEIMCQRLFPQLAHIPRQSYEDIPKFRMMPPEQMAQCVADINSSWLGREMAARNISIDPNPVHDYLKFWGIYCMASICEHLINNGYKVKFN